MGLVGPQKKGFELDKEACDSLRGISSRFVDFTMDYTCFFNAYRRNVSPHARNYLAGLLMKAPRKNMERICEIVEGGQYANYQHFISDSRWDYIALKEQIAHDANELLGGENAVLCLDESGFTKKGKKSVGVSRQYNGRLGKVDNCQVGVFASLCNGVDRSNIVDFRLFLPDEWVSDPERCAEAGVPEEQVTKKTKLEHAYDMVADAVRRGLDFQWISADAFYGRDLDLVNKLDDLGKNFTVDVPVNFSVYLEDPKPYLPRRRNNTGRKFTRLRARTNSSPVSALFNRIEEHDWKTITVRETTRGNLRLLAHAQRVYTWDGIEKQARQCWIAFTYDPITKERKQILCNADISTDLSVIVRKHACRFWIERAFQDGKTSIGMADYQVRGWLGWHHHMTMVMMASLFMVKERLLNHKTVNLLSCQDIVDLLSYYLPRKDLTEEGVFRNLQKRHEQRRQAIESAKRQQKLREAKVPK